MEEDLNLAQIELKSKDGKEPDYYIMDSINQERLYQYEPCSSRQFYALPLETNPPKNIMSPYYSALLTQFIIQIFIILQIITILNLLSFDNPLYFIIVMGGTLSVGFGATMILITFFISIEYYNKRKDLKYMSAPQS